MLSTLLSKLRKTLLPKAEDFEAFPIDEHARLPRRAVPFIWYFVKRMKLPLGTVFTLYLFGTILWTIEPLFFGLFVDSIANASDWVAALPKAGWVVAAYILCVQVFMKVFHRLGHAVEAHAYPVLTLFVRRQLSVYLYNHSYRFFQEDFAGRLAGSVVEMPNAVTDTLNNIMDDVQNVVVGAIVSVSLFTYVDWRFGIMALAFITLSYTAGRWHIPRLLQKSDAAAETEQVMRGRYIDSISNILLVKLFSRRKHEDNVLLGALTASGKARQAEIRQQMIFWRTQDILSSLFQIGVIVLCVYGYFTHSITLGGIATALPLSAATCENVWRLIDISVSFFSRFATINNALDTIIQEQEVLDKPGAKPLIVHRPEIALSRVKFGYPNHPVFDDLSLHISAYQKIGIVGPSGAGKSTLVQLLLRLYDIQGGSIQIDGQDISAVTQQSLRDAVSVIPQTTDLMHRSILENIRYSKPDATFEEVVEAARKAYIHDFIITLKDHFGNEGYDALVGERGVKLSGGQRQRIAIARAFLKNAPILLLDEATSSLDSESEVLIQKSLHHLVEGKTVIIIAHRLSTLRHLERIVVMQNGRIVEDDHPDALLAQNGLYARLCELQATHS